MKKQNWKLGLGATWQGAGKVHFKVWAPHAKSVAVSFVKPKPEKKIELAGDENGYFEGDAAKISLGARYFVTLDGEKNRPDPVSRALPEGVHGPSEIVDPNGFKWTDQKWKGRKLADYFIYELHVGTFTREGTFESAIKKIPHLKSLGVSCVEIMPVAQFPGERNWGYDGVSLYSVQNSYGGEQGLKQLINALHLAGIAVCLDVVYNHLGPEGNYLGEFGPYFTHKYDTPWGTAVNYDDRGSDAVREYVLSNALYWFYEFHVDALRLDAIHCIYDLSAQHILQELSLRTKQASRELKRPLYLIAESDLNDTKIIADPKQGGYGIDAQWSDDFHHALHVALTGESESFFQDFNGVKDLAKAVETAFVYDGKFSRFRGRRFGNSAQGFPVAQFIHNIQNHDQVGNRPHGERLSALCSLEAQKVAAVLLMMSPQIPHLWMGQEYGETNPFLYFIDHGDLALVEAVRKGRKNEFISKGVKNIPDPKSEEVYNRCKLDWQKPLKDPHRRMLALYADLAKLRARYKVSAARKVSATFNDDENCITFQYTSGAGERLGVVASLSTKPVVLKFPFTGKAFQEILHTRSKQYGGLHPFNKTKQVGEIELMPQTAILGKITS